MFKDIVIEKKHWFIFFISLFFSALNIYFLTKAHYELVFASAVLAIIFLLVLSADKIFYLATFAVPLSVNYIIEGPNLGISMPSELLMILLLIFFIIKFIFQIGFDLPFLNHPISKIIMVYFLWMSLSIVWSTMPLISFKFLLVRLWFIIPFYFFASQIFKKLENINLFFWLFSIGLAIAIVYTWTNHAKFGFTQKDSYLVMKPLFVDHTVYGGAISFFVFYPLIYFLFPIFHKRNFIKRFFSFLLFLIIVLGLFFSFSRAAWLGVIVASLFVIPIYLKIKFRVLIITIFLAIGGLIYFGPSLYSDMKKNSEKNTMESMDALSHAKSISNVSTDVSNVERLNRWDSGFRMFEEKPILGWGPGTYMFQYSPFQRGLEMTVISSTLGDAGGIHNEYLNHLIEMGIPGLIIYFILVLMVLFYGLKIVASNKSSKIKLLAIASLLGLITYFVHGFVNNFLDQDKVAVPFWAMIAILVSLDLYQEDTAIKT